MRCMADERAVQYLQHSWRATQQLFDPSTPQTTDRGTWMGMGVVSPREV